MKSVNIEYTGYCDAPWCNTTKGIEKGDPIITTQEALGRRDIWYYYTGSIGKKRYLVLLHRKHWEEEISGIATLTTSILISSCLFCNNSWTC